jgi:hypothetical protein
MPVSRYRAYEEVSKIEENAFLDEAIELVWRIPKLRSWVIREPPRRPEERYWERPLEFSWQADRDRAITHTISGRGIQRDFFTCMVSTRIDEAIRADESS